MTPRPEGFWSGLNQWSQSIVSRLGLRVSLAVFISIIAVETLILIPSYLRYEAELLDRLEHVGRSIMLSNFRSHAHATDSDLMLYGKLLLTEPDLLGGTLYRPDGSPIGSFGEPPEIAPGDGETRRRSPDGTRLDVVWLPEATGIPFGLSARLDASWVTQELEAFVVRMLGLVVVIGLVVCGTAMVFVGQLVLRPIVRLHRAVAAAEAQPDRPDLHSIASYGNDELQSVVRAFNRMIGKIARDLRTMNEASRDLEGLNRTLEARVEERTLDLQRSNSQLESEIAERKQAEARILHEAFHDQVTGLANRRLLIDRIDGAIQRARRHADCTFAVLLINLSRFRVVNEDLGHAAGDVLLGEIAKRLQELVRGSDTLARSDGDEFCIVAEEVKSRTDIEQLVGRIQRIFKTPVPVQDEEIVCGASIGVAINGCANLRSERLIAQARVALFRARELGRFYAIFDEAMEVVSPGILRLESDLRRALDRPDAFELHYQPVIDLARQDLAGFEALIRWRQPDGELVSPGQFIALAEDTGIIVPLGRWILEEGMGQLVSWQKRFRLPSQFSVAFNVSGRQLQDPRFVSEVADCLERHQLAPNLVKLEVTESSLLKNPQEAGAILTDIKALGVGLSIDDFGTGYSSLSYLRKFPFDVLKIDRSFILAMNDDAEGRGMVHAIIEIALMLKMATVAEGVETQEDLKALQQLGCDYAQGFLFDPPLEPEHAERRLASSVARRTERLDGADGPALDKLAG